MEDQEQSTHVGNIKLPPGFTEKVVRIKCEAAYLIPLDQLVIIQGNLKELSQENYTKLAKSIIVKGFIAPFFVWYDGEKFNLLDGTQRKLVLTQMKKEGWTIPDLPVAYVEADNLVDAKEKLLQITSSYGQIINDGLYEFCQDIPDFKDSLGDFKLPDFDIGNFAGSFFADPEPPKSGLTDDDHVPEVVTPVTKKGDLWILSDHRLYCGDSTMINDVEKLMNGEKADMVFTDPPYNVAVVGGCKNPLDPKYQSGKTIQNDKMSDEDFYKFLCDCYTAMHIASKDGAVSYITHADSYGHIFRNAFIDSGWQLKQCIIWRKHAFVFGRQDYHWQHEPILYGWKEKQSHKFYGSRDQSTVWDFNRPSPSDKKHPTMKPVELIEKGINNSSKAGDLLFEPFCGSGSTLIACEKTNRKCYSLELDEHYCDVIVNRWQEYTGKEATLEATGAKYSELKAAAEEMPGRCT